MAPVLSDSLLQALLWEDAPFGDLTTDSLALSDRSGSVVLAALQPMTVCGVEEGVRLLELCGARAHAVTPTGRHVLAGTELLTAHGAVPALLRAVGVARSLLEKASGIASDVARVVTVLRAAGCAQTVACPRSVWPGSRALAAHAVRAGGGEMHSLGLSETVLLQPSHRVFVDHSIEDMVGRLRRLHPTRRVMAEATSMEDALALAAAGAEVLQLEGFAPDAVRACKLALHASHLHPVLAVSGRIDGDNAVAYAFAGADVLITAAPCQAAPCAVEVRLSRDV